MEQSKSLLLIKSSKMMTQEFYQRLKEITTPIAERCGCEVLIADESFDASIHSDIKPLIEEQLSEQRKTNELLLMLIEALAEDQGVDDEEGQPARHLDGTPV